MDILRIIQITILTVIVFPAIMNLMLEPFKRKHYRSYRVMFLFILTLIGLLATIVISIIYVNKNEIYIDVKYSEFYQLLDAFKTTSALYLIIIACILLFYGAIFFVTYLINRPLFNNMYYEVSIKNINFNDFTFGEKFFRYVFLYIECNYYIRKTKKGLRLLSKRAYKQYNEYLNKMNISGGQNA